MNNKKFAVLVLGLAVVFAGTWTYIKAEGEQISMCVKKSGLVYVIGEDFRRADCKKNDSLLSWNVAGLQGLKGDKGDTGEQGSAGQSGLQLHLFDANNQDLGILVKNYQFTTFLPELGVFVYFSDTDNGPTDPHLKIGESKSVVFTGLNCTGDSFLPNLAPLVVLHDNQGRYLVPTGELPKNRIALSNYDGGGCHNQAPYTYEATYLLEEITLPFFEPLLKPLRVELM